MRVLGATRAKARGVTSSAVGSSAWFGEVFIRELEIYAAEGLVVWMVWNRFEAVPQVRNGSESSNMRRLRPVASTLAICMWFESPNLLHVSVRTSLDTRSLIPKSDRFAYR